MVQDKLFMCGVCVCMCVCLGHLYNKWVLLDVGLENKILVIKKTPGIKGNLTQALISDSLHTFPKSLFSTDGAVATRKPEEYPYLNYHWRKTWPYRARSLGAEEWPVQTARHRCSLLGTGSSPFPTGCCTGHDLRLPGGLQGQPALQPTYSAEVRERAWAHNQGSTEGRSELLEGKS